MGARLLRQFAMRVRDGSEHPFVPLFASPVRQGSCGAKDKADSPAVCNAQNHKLSITTIIRYQNIGILSAQNDV